MEKKYDDELLPENFEALAQAYAQTLKDRGFVFVNLKEEEFNLLIGEIFMLISKMRSCLVRLHKQFDSSLLDKKLLCAQDALQQKFGNKKNHQFKFIGDETNAFLCLVSLENLFILKLMILSVKSGELELCNNISTSIASVFAESFQCESFKAIL